MQDEENYMYIQHVKRVKIIPYYSYILIMWNADDEKGFWEYVPKKEGMVKNDSAMAEKIRELCANEGNWTFLEVGAWNGWGSTRVFVEALKERDEDFFFYTLETNKDKHNYVTQLYASEPNVFVLNEKVSDPHEKEVDEMFPEIKRSPELRVWNNIDQVNSRFLPMFFDRKKGKRSVPDKIDVVLLDGGEFTTWFDFLALKQKTNNFLLTCICNSKNKHVFANLLQDMEWSEVKDKSLSSAECAMFERVRGPDFVKKVVVRKIENVPVVIHHTGGKQDYFQNSVRINARNNEVIVIGDVKNQDAQVFQEKHNHHITFVNVDTLHSQTETEFRNCFVNYSFQPLGFELHCFLRVFFLLELMKKLGLRKVFYVDSDCVTLCDISKVLSHLPQLSVGYSIQKHKQRENKHHMTGCIHNAVLTQDMCVRFIRLCFDVYGTRDKFSLIEKKWDHHQLVMAGGICDMTMWYLYEEHKGEGAEKVSDLNDLYEFAGEQCTFDHNINDPYGFEGNNTYQMGYCENVNKWAETKNVVRRGDKYYATTNSGKEVRLLTMHYQGGAKEGLDNNVHCV